MTPKAVEQGELVTVRARCDSGTQESLSALEQCPKDRFPTQAVYGHTPDAEVRLITCGGSFEKAVKSYRDNIVAFGTLTAVA